MARRSWRRQKSTLDRSLALRLKALREFLPAMSNPLEHSRPPSEYGYYRRTSQSATSEAQRNSFVQTERNYLPGNGISARLGPLRGK
jgi:hypothetical protein